MGRLTIMRHATAVAQHHDAVTGTERQHVADDYTARLNLGLQNCEAVRPLGGCSDFLFFWFCGLCVLAPAAVVMITMDVVLSPLPPW